MPGMLICPSSLSAEQLLGEKAPAEEKGPPRSRNLMACACRNPRYPPWAGNARHKSREDDRGCCLCEKSPGCSRQSTRPPPWHQQASKVHSSPLQHGEGARETRAIPAQTPLAKSLSLSSAWPQMHHGERQGCTRLAIQAVSTLLSSCPPMP